MGEKGNHVFLVFSFGCKPEMNQTINGFTVWQALNYQNNSRTGSSLDEFCEMPWHSIDVMRNQHSPFIGGSGENLRIRRSLKLGFVRSFEINHRLTTLDA